MRVLFKDNDGALFVTEAVEIVHDSEDVLTVTSFYTCIPNNEIVSLKLEDLNFEVPDREIDGLIEQAFVHGKLDLRGYKYVQVLLENEENTDRFAADYLRYGGLE